jgi:hypothetical protein
MRFPRWVRLVTVPIFLTTLLGCGNKPTGMANMQLGTGPNIQKELKSRKTKRELPPEPPPPKAPP